MMCKLGVTHQLIDSFKNFSINAFLRLERGSNCRIVCSKKEALTFTKWFHFPVLTTGSEVIMITTTHFYSSRSFWEISSSSSKLRMNNANHLYSSDKQHERLFYRVLWTCLKVRTKSTTHFYSSRQTKWIITLQGFINWFKS